MVDWSRLSEPPPAELICNLDLINITRGGASLTGRAREKALDKMARDLEARSEPYIRDRIRHPGRNR